MSHSPTSPRKLVATTSTTTERLLTTLPTAFSEQADSLIPSFTLPVKSWALRIQQILLSRHLDLKNDEISDVFTPLIIAKLPSYLLRMVKNKNLHDTLSFLGDFDKGLSDPLSLLRCCTHLEYDPSIEFTKIFDKIKDTIGKGITDKAAKIFAYQILLNMFPASLQIQITLLDVNDFPNTDQLARIDRMYKKYNSEKNKQNMPLDTSPLMNNSVPNQQSQILNKIDSIMSRLSIFEANQTPASSSQPRNNWRQTEPTNITRYPARNNQFQYQNRNTTNPYQTADNPNFCFFHNRFGIRARRCTQPCSYPQTSKNAAGAPTTP